MRPHGRRAAVNPGNPEALAQCDRCGFWYNRSKLQWQFQWAGTHLQNLGFLVCKICIDTPFEQLRTIILPPDPPPVLNARPPNFTYEEAGPVQTNLTASASMGSVNLPVQSVTGFVVGNLIWIQLNIGTFTEETISGIDPINNILTISTPLPALAPINGTITVSSTTGP
jgi:hypothetical protein